MASPAHTHPVLDAWQADYNAVQPHSVLPKLALYEFTVLHIDNATSTGNSQTSTLASTADWKEVGSQSESLPSAERGYDEFVGLFDERELYDMSYTAVWFALSLDAIDRELTPA